MPPIPLQWRGRDVADRSRTATAIRLARLRMVATRPRPARLRRLRRDPQAPILHAAGLLVLTLAGDRICAMTRFGTSMLVYFGLPRALPG